MRHKRVMKDKQKSSLLIKLRPWSVLDLNHLVKFANNKKIADNLTDAFPFPYSREDGINFINRFKDDVPMRAFAIEVDGIPCGAIGVHPQADIHRKSAEMGYWLAEEYWGKGIMTEAVRMIIEYGFQAFDINRIFARPFSINIASRRVLEKAGLKFEAKLEKSIFKNDQYLDELIFSIIR
jgi:[ribosomal protein S5]-alanine N-acetyltransferase